MQSTNLDQNKKFGFLKAMALVMSLYPIPIVLLGDLHILPAMPSPHDIVLYIYGSIGIYAYYNLKKKYTNFLFYLLLLQISSFVTFTSALIFVTFDPLSPVWFIFVIFFSYFLGSKKIGTIATAASILAFLTVAIFIAPDRLMPVASTAIAAYIITASISIFFYSIIEANEKEILSQKEAIEEINQDMKSSIEYASLIQNALLPQDQLLHDNFKDSFVIWKPKDIVGGDIYLFEKLRHEDESLLMVIDCTGHGVPGAFVTMLVKAIEREIILNIKNSKDEVNPALILEYFNKTMKNLLKQDGKASISNAGFDGGIVYINKKEKVIKFAGAETQLFYIQDNKLNTIKGDRQSIGYKNSDLNYKFTEHTISIEKDTTIYLTTDGYLDQTGGEKGFSFGKKRFKSLLESNSLLPLDKQKKLFEKTMNEYRNNHEIKDDNTMVAISI